MPVSRGSSLPRDRTRVSSVAGGFFTIGATRQAQRCHDPSAAMNISEDYTTNVTAQDRGSRG